MDRQCVVCHEKVATFRCIQCHKPVCSDCGFKTENGAFCSRECATNYRDFARAKGPAPRSSGGLLKPLIGLIILAAIALFVIHRVKPDLVPWFPF